MLDVVKKLEQLDTLLPGRLLDNLFPLIEAQTQLEMVFNQSVYAQYLRASREKGNELYAVIEQPFSEGESDLGQKQISEQEIVSIKSIKNHFLMVFRSEISTLPIFLVSKKEPYDSISLIEDGVRLFPFSIKAKAPETERDCVEAGKALAYELGTACGFHLFRVTESVVKRYWDEVTNKAKRPKLETLGNYAAELEKREVGDEKIVESIKQMTRLHRNPTIHPEVILTVEEAIGIVGMARSVVGAMLAILPDVPPTTGTLAAAPSP